MPHFLVSGTVHASWSRTVEAKDDAEARTKVEEEIEAYDWEPAIEDVQDASVDYVQPLPPFPPPQTPQAPAPPRTPEKNGRS